jgi:MFS family permease
LGDKIGLKATYLIGIGIFALFYLGMAMASDYYVFLGLFFLYGFYAASTEGISKAWISNVSEKKDVGTALGFYSSFNSICTICASSLAGLIWYNISAEATFLVTGVGALLVVMYFLLTRVKAVK